MEPRDRLLLYDTCCLINVCATGHESEILAAQALPAGIVQRASEETIYLRRGGTGEDAEERDPIDLSVLIAEGLMTLVVPKDQREHEAFANLVALRLDDGEAWTLAIAQMRGFEVATDDRPARRAIREAGETTRRHSTVDLLKRWVTRCAVPAEALRQAILDVEQRARYHPSRKDPAECAWWDAARRAP